MAEGRAAGGRARTRWLRANRRRIGLRGRVALAFGLISTMVTTVLALVAWLLISGFVVGQRVRTAIRLAAGHAAEVDSGLQQPDPDVPKLIDGLQTAPGSSVLLWYRDQWYGGLPPQGDPPLPDELTRMVISGTPATQRIQSGRELLLAVGIPLPRSRAAFFELFTLDDLNRTLTLLAVSLLVAVLILSLSTTAVGWFISRIALRPLTSLTDVASAVAAGDLDARMSDDGDPDLRELAQSFNRTADTLRQRVAADARFAGDVSHELRTPLTTMINSMQLIQNRRADLPPAVLEPVDLLADDLERFRRLVVDLIEISRHDSGVPGDREPVVVADLIRRAADQAAGRPVTVISPDAAGATMSADKRRLERVFANLVDNAEVHGGGCVAVAVSRHGDEIRVVVDDAGPGVPEERRERIFERFARAGQSSDQASGVGLGLAIVERHVHWHGGSVCVDDRPGGGARFVVTLPLRRHPTP